MKSESLFLPVSGNHILHVKHIYQERTGTPVFMLHGAIENGKIFYSESGKGFAYFLAEKGYDVFVLDQRGRGKSTPRISKNSTFSQKETLKEDIHACIREIEKQRGLIKQIWVGHSWGGVLLTAFLARNPSFKQRVDRLIYFGTKRSVRVKNIHRFVLISFAWNTLAPLLVKWHGYLPTITYKYGSDNESAGTLSDSIRWVKNSVWLDEDGFNYHESLQSFSLPETLYVVGKKDYCLGHISDVKRFIDESGNHAYTLMYLSKKHGFQKDYDHINMLTDPRAVNDHFQRIYTWLCKN